MEVDSTEEIAEAEEKCMKTCVAECRDICAKAKRTKPYTGDGYKGMKVMSV